MSNLKQSLKNTAIKFYLNGIYPSVLRHRVKKIARKDKIEVVFFALNLAMWRYQGVYELLSQDSRFNCHIVLTVPNTFSDEQKAVDLQQLRDYFDAKGIKYHDYDEVSQRGFNVKERINPDILFYPQPYEKLLKEEHEYSNFKSKLWCYLVYGISVVNCGEYFSYDLPFHNLAWRVYCPIQIVKDNAVRIARNSGRNWVLSGYPNFDRYCQDDVQDVWKINDRKIKRLIWAPHFTLSQGLTWLNSRSSFLWLYEMMLDLAQKYHDRLQIAFKPHPRLKSELYNHPDWGKERTDRYYQRWADGENTQLETGDFVDLFKTSDAMLHDSCSFTAEYLYVNKPVAFVTANFEGLLADHNEFGQAALKQHYIVKNKQEVESFIENVVLGGKDSMAPQRTAFFNEVLRPNVTGSTSQFIVEDIKKGLGLD